MPIRGPDPTPIDSRSMAQDFTTRNARTAAVRTARIEQHDELLEKLTFSNILLRGVIESSPDGILVANNINKILTYNQKFLEMWNISPRVAAAGINEKLLLIKAQALKDPERYVENIRFQHAHPKDESRYETEFKDGRVFEESTTVLRHQDKYLGRIWFYHEITNIRQATQTLADSEERLKTILDTSVDGILIVDAQTGKLVQGNRAIITMLGYGPAELLTLCLDDIHPVETLAETRRLFQSGVIGEARVWNSQLDPVECPDKGSGGKEVSGEFVVTGGDASPVFDAAEVVLDFVASSIEALGAISFLDGIAAARDDR